MSNYITTHNADGKAIFSSKLPTEANPLPLGPLNKCHIVYSNNTFPPNLSTETDIDEYAEVRSKGHSPGRICPENGVTTAIMTFGPGSQSPWHRTSTIDTAIVVEGVIELYLDGGDSEVKTLQAGDTVVQRGTMHKWKNVTPNQGVVRMVCVSNPIAPLEIGGQSLKAEMRR